jgi:hypothetical protein
MSPITHFLTGWALANSAGLSPRERMIVTIAGVIPDIDSLGLIAELGTRGSERPMLWWSEYHHVLGHNLGFALLIGVLAFGLSKRRGITMVLALLSFHLHLLGDLIGARGPDGEQWPIPYMLPFSEAWRLAWSGQWPLNAWPNMLLTACLMGLALYVAWRRGYSPLEMVSKRADQAVVQALRRRFPFQGKAGDTA